MGIYIPGIEMPISCSCCPLAEDNGRFCRAAVAYIPMTGHPWSCPLVEVPAHGRMVDADKLEEEIDFSLQQVNAYLDNFDTDYYSAEYREMEARAECYREALEHIRAAQTVIPEEETMNQEAKADKGKPRLTLVPRRIIWDIAKVREYGCEKYHDPDNWKKVEAQRYRDAAFRHFMAYLDEPNGVDAESGLPHLAHLACNIAFLCELETQHE